jgi:phage/plasmid-like protein (TIGR03299 family)
MSNETVQHLNTNTLIGHTSERGTAWHYRAEDQGDESNHYAGAIPVDDVRRRLFSWTAESCRVAAEVASDTAEMTHLDHAGLPARWQVVEGRQAVSRSDNNHVMGIFASGYERHQYAEWLLTSVGNILDDDLSISSAGLLREGAIAWVEVSVPESMTTVEGVQFRPNLLATTSFDGSIATTYKRTITATVCDNTRELALGEAGQQMKVKHSRNSRLRLGQARAALQVVHEMADSFAAEVAELCRTAVNKRQWSAFLDGHVPTTHQDGRVLEGRARTIATAKRDDLQKLYASDCRVAPWAGTAYGVIQAVNTWEHHMGVVRNASRGERNMLRTVSGDFAKVDQRAWARLRSILIAA